MNGIAVREKLKKSGYSLGEIALKMGISQQALYSNLKAKDVKSGVIEEIARVIHQDVSFFYNSDNEPSITADSKKGVRNNFNINHNDTIYTEKAESKNVSTLGALNDIDIHLIIRIGAYTIRTNLFF